MLLVGYDWEAVFEFTSGGEPQGGSDYLHTCVNAKGHNVSPCVGDAYCPATPFGLADVVEVIAASDGENDGASWLCVVRLKDGRFVKLP